MPDIDASKDLGTAPLGLTKRANRCSYQWAVEGPLGAVIFYCTQDVACSGDPHRVAFKDKRQSVTIEFRCGDAPKFLLLAVDRTSNSDLIVWWAPNRSGYVECVARAGRYTFEEAMRLSAHCDDPIPVPLENVADEHFIPVNRKNRDAQLAGFRSMAAHARELFNV